MLTDYQTRLMATAIATLRQTLPPLRDSLEHLASVIRERRLQPDTVNMAWLELEQVLGHLDLLERTGVSFSEHSGGRSTNEGGARGPEMIRAIRSVELAKVLHVLHAIAGTPVEGYIAQESA